MLRDAKTLLSFSLVLATAGLAVAEPSFQGRYQIASSSDRQGPAELVVTPLFGDVYLVRQQASDAQARPRFGYGLRRGDVLELVLQRGAAVGMRGRLGGAEPLQQATVRARLTLPSSGRPGSYQEGAQRPTTLSAAPALRAGHPDREGQEASVGVDGALGAEDTEQGEPSSPGPEGATAAVPGDASTSSGWTPASAADDRREATVRRYFESLDLDAASPAFGLEDARNLEADPSRPDRDALPAAVRAAYDFYARAEAQDWAGVSLHSGELDGAPLYALWTSTDGDDRYLELFDGDGRGLGSAALLDGETLDWDAWQGRARTAPTFGHLGRTEEGLSEPDEARESGQIPPQRGWTGALTIDDLRVEFAPGRSPAFSLPAGLGNAERAVATAALNLVADRVLRHRQDGGVALLGAAQNGVLVLGRFTRPDDGKSYLVADWRDIDDASSTYYYELTPAGPVLAIDQFNN